MANVVPADRSAGVKSGVFGKGLGFRSTASDDSGPVDFTDKADIAATELEDSGTAANVSIADAGSFTAQTTVEAALQEIYAKLPSTDVLTVAFDVDDGSTGETPTASGLAFTPKASTKYFVELDLNCTATTNGGIEFTFTGPTAATFVGTALIYQADNVVDQTVIATIGGAVNYIAAALVTDRITITGYLVVVAADADFVLLAAQNTAHADNTLVHIGSVLRATPLV